MLREKGLFILPGNWWVLQCKATNETLTMPGGVMSHPDLYKYISAQI